MKKVGGSSFLELCELAYLFTRFSLHYFRFDRCQGLLLFELRCCSCHFNYLLIRCRSDTRGGLYLLGLFIIWHVKVIHGGVRVWKLQRGEHAGLGESGLHLSLLILLDGTTRFFSLLLFLIRVGPLAMMLVSSVGRGRSWRILGRWRLTSVTFLVVWLWPRRPAMFVLAGRARPWWLFVFASAFLRRLISLAAVTAVTAMAFAITSTVTSAATTVMLIRTRSLSRTTSSTWLRSWGGLSDLLLLRRIRSGSVCLVPQRGGDRSYITALKQLSLFLGCTSQIRVFTYWNLSGTCRLRNCRLWHI